LYNRHLTDIFRTFIGHNYWQLYGGKIGAQMAHKRLTNGSKQDKAKG